VALLVGAWTVPGLLSAIQIYVEEVVRDGNAYSAAQILWYALPMWWAWIPLTFGVMALSRRFPLLEEWRPSSLAVHGLGCIGIAFLHLVLSAAWSAFTAPGGEGVSVGGQLVSLAVVDDVRVLLNLFIYWLIVGGVHTFEYYRESRERRLRESRLQTQLKSAQLDALRARLRPHFLFNTLSAIQTLTLRNGDTKSAQMIARLSEFLRTTLDEENDHLIPLADELSFVDQYVAIEKCRFEDRLTVETDVDPSAKSVPVPTLILQPLVENAIRHGIEPKESPGRVLIEAWPAGDRVGLRVTDDGVGADPAETRHLGEGLSNTRKRLAQLYGDDHTVTVDAEPGTGFSVTLVLPVEDVPVPGDAEGDQAAGNQMPAPEVSLS
jgi:signal transduction histidine kinase